MTPAAHDDSSPEAGFAGREASSETTSRSREGGGSSGNPGFPHVVDPITFEVIRNALVAATDEMVLALRRSAYSTNIKTRSDFSCAFFDAQLRSVAQGFAQPVHLGSMVEQVPRAVLDYGPENLGPGDVIVTNDPYPSGVHLNDVSLISPVYCEDELLGYVANLAHHVDVGGGAPASVGAFREVFQEGVIIPPVKVVEAGQIVPDVFRLILAQIRSKHETGGDLRAQVAANNTGVRRLRALVERHGREAIMATMNELLDYTERRTRAEIAALPHGAFEAEGSIDTDGYTDEPVHLKARIEISDAGVHFDLDGSDPQRRAPVNSTFAQTFSACAYAVKCLIDPDLPVNDGFYRLVTVDAPKGSVTNCTWPSPVVGGWETQTRLVDVIFRALLPALPERMAAGSKAMMCHAGFGGVDPVTREYYCFLETFGGGYGARLTSDGPDAVQTHGQNTENAPVEETELNYPVRVTRLSLVEDSEGPGRFRGGLGLRKDYLFDRPTTFTVLADRDKAGPWGVLGGLDGSRAEYVLVRGGEEHRLAAKGTIEVEPGDAISYRTCGGGGYGPPHERDPERVLRDVREGKVSAARAREIYKVALDAETRGVDLAATAALRRRPRVAMTRREP
jgi:N-methylhydantoinase B